ncbi:uncharacterized protein TM35_000202570 [Trypanosoma theileri]|uniref:Uncharacterized protein n=1 Tax=Trypanosoma theileri TaxID=67003 RepID=A0A1X0NTH9_9TRYP|nr:uncharacterized protein TM35_000202570 [Trypanosoma theileri]ORC87848.1 hypothetical protein TM35_000202570 [Trypanosoma theileri]
MQIPTADVKCLATIIESIVKEVQEETVVEERVVDLLALIPDVFQANPMAQRIAYLITTVQPLAVVVCLIRPSLQSCKINLAALNVLLEVVTFCLNLPDFSTIEATMTAHLVDTNVLYGLLDSLFSRGNEVIRASAAELLFILVARITLFGRTLTETVGVMDQISVLVFNTGSPFAAVSEYLAGILRVSCGRDPATLPPTLLREALTLLATRCQEPSRVVILIAECVEILITHHPYIYLRSLETGEVPSLNNILMVSEKIEDKQWNALMNLLGTLLQIEGQTHVDDIERQTAAYKVVLHDKKLWSSQEAFIRGMHIVFHAINAAITETVQLHMTSTFLRSFPLICRVIMEGSQDVREHASLIISLTLAKNAQVRTIVIGLTRNYLEWSKELLEYIINSILSFDFKDLPIIDATGIILNDPATLPHEKETDIDKWAETLLMLQEERMICGEHHEVREDALQRVRDSSIDDTFLLSCTKAILLKACKKSFIVDTTSVEKKKEGYKKWLTQQHKGFQKQTPEKSTLSNDRKKSLRKGKKHQGGSRTITTDDNFSMAVLSYLPLLFGVYFNRAQRPSPQRKLYGLNGIVMQDIHRNTQRSWNLDDVLMGELYSFFIPFHELTAERVEIEVLNLKRLTRELSRKLLTIPISQRSRRCFLTDMVNNILPKTELLVRELADMLHRHGPESILYQLGLIRLLDAHLLDAAAPEMHVSREITVLSQFVFKDVVHSGNLMYCITQLRQRFSEKI